MYPPAPDTDAHEPTLTYLSGIASEVPTEKKYYRVTQSVLAHRAYGPGNRAVSKGARCLLLSPESHNVATVRLNADSLLFKVDVCLPFALLEPIDETN